MLSPRVSICIPTYNYGEYLCDSLDSALSQTTTDIEILVVDNCSTDNTKEIVNKYLISDSRVKYICNDTNIGMVGNWNKCINIASGTYIKLLCADDVLDPQCIEKSLNILESNSNISLVTCSRRLVDSCLKPKSIVSFSLKEVTVKGTDAIKKCFFCGNLIGETTSVLFRKKHCSRGFNIKYKHLADLEMWFYLLEQGDLVSLPEALCSLRQHSKQSTKESLIDFAVLAEEIAMYNDYIDKYYIGNNLLNNTIWKYKLALYIYSHKLNGVPMSVIHRKIREIMPITLFYFIDKSYKAVKKIGVNR